MSYYNTICTTCDLYRKRDFTRCPTPVPDFRAGLIQNLPHATSREKHTERLKTMENGGSEYEYLPYDVFKWPLPNLEIGYLERDKCT